MQIIIEMILYIVGCLTTAFIGYQVGLMRNQNNIVHSEYYVKSKLDLNELQFNVRCNNGTFQVVILDGKRYVTDESYRAYKNENCI